MQLTDMLTDNISEHFIYQNDLIVLSYLVYTIDLKLKPIESPGFDRCASIYSFIFALKLRIAAIILKK